MHLRGVFIGFICALSAFAQPDIPTLLKTGDTAYLKGQYDQARDAFLQAWEAAQETPADNPVRYDILKRLTNVRAAAGEFADADQWLQKALAWREAVSGPQDPKIADDLLLSVGLNRSMKAYEQAMTIMQRVQKLHTSIYGPNSPFFADDFSRMAQIYAELKRPEQAIAMYKLALEVRKRLSGPLDPSLVPDLDRMGELYNMVRDYENAEATFRHDLIIRETVYGKIHVDLISTVDGLAYALFGQKNYDAAEPVYRRLLELWEASVGKDHPMIAVTLDKISVFYADQKKLAEAHEALERSVAIRAHFQAQGISHQGTQALGEGKMPEAKAYYQRALVVLGDPNPVTEELRKQFEGILKAMEQSAQRKPMPKK